MDDIRFINTRQSACGRAFDTKETIYEQPKLTNSQSDTSMEDQTYQNEAPDFHSEEKRRNYDSLMQSQYLGVPDQIVYNMRQSGASQNPTKIRN